jgi:phage protein U
MRRSAALALVSGGAAVTAVGGAIVGRLRTRRSEHDVRGRRGRATFASCARGTCTLEWGVGCCPQGRKEAR